MEAGHGLIVIDSKGDTATEIADLTTRRDAVLFDPADERPLGFNLLGGAADAELIVDHVIGSFRARFGAMGLGPRSEDVLRAALLTLATQPGMTLCEVEPLLSNPGFRQRLVGALDEPVLESFWGWFGALSDGARAEVVGPLNNKLRSFTLRRRVRTIIGQSEGLDFGRTLDRGEVVLINLAKGLIGEDAVGLLGSAMVSRLWAAIQGRAALAPEARRPVTVICDEFQDFARLPLSLGDAVAQSRGYGVGWVLAHQHLQQLDTTTRSAVLANCRSRIVMQTTATDASVFAREFGAPLEASDFQGLPAFEGYAQVSTAAAVAAPASIRTRPPLAPGGCLPRIRAYSRHAGANLDEVNASIRARVGSRRSSGPIGGIGRTP
jgi:hypothetical protein